MTNDKKDLKEKTVVSSFKTYRVTDINKAVLYTDSLDVANRNERNKTYAAKTFQSHADVIAALNQADANNETILAASKKAYATNPLYAKIINYFSTMFMWRYSVVPQQLRADKKLGEKKWKNLYNTMLDLVDGMSLEVKMPQLLTRLWLEGGIYITALFVKESSAVDLIILPNKYCKRIGETQYGTGIITFDFSYFDSLGLDKEGVKELLQGFSEEMQEKYLFYKTNPEMRWQMLDPSFSTAILQNEKSVPLTFYVYGSILNYEKYSENEIERNSDQLERILVHKIPTYQDHLIMEIPEMNALHRKLSGIVKSASKTRLITTIGDITVKPLQENETRENTVLARANKTVFNEAGLNGALFAGETAEAINAGRLIDKGVVWSKVEEIINFLNFSINNLIDFKGYQVEITMLPITRDRLEADIAVFRENAKLGVGILNFIVASGIKQKNIESYLDMEENLGLATRLKPLQSSYTVSGKDLEEEEKVANKKIDNEIEPSTTDPINSEKKKETVDEAE